MSDISADQTAARLSEPMRYALIGFGFGLLFSCGALLLLYLLGELYLADGFLSSLVRAHRQNPLLFIIHTVPVLLSVFAFFMGTQQARIRRFSQTLEHDIEEKTRDLQSALEEMRIANETILHLAEHDALTGLLNRRRFQKDLERWAEHALRYRRGLALMFLDLDNFKRVNDMHGHAVGDEYLKGVAALVRECLRGTDFVGRWGGDELAVLLPETSADEAVEVANKLLDAFNRRPVVAGGRDWSVGASIGIASLPRDTNDPHQLVAFADAAMYEAKQSGGGAWRMYAGSPEEMNRIQERIRWEARLRRALENEQFVMHYQPVLDLATGATPFYEALLRMEEPDGTLLAPGAFLAYAEEFSLSRPMDRMVIRKAARRIAALDTQGVAVEVSVNLSVKSLRDRDLARYVIDVVAEAGIAPERLGFEISESIAVQQDPLIVQVASELRAAGCRLILDDFSAELSSLHVLEQLGVRLVKLDARAVRALGDASGRQALRELAQVAQERGIAVVAKSVEEHETLEVLRACGVQYAQGYAVGRPLESLEQALVAGAAR